mgnify:CR=1 FL=1|jgi:hypothetical protein|tara:strand:+ start:376 stop:753 length:378 start_codon:yes stop_codon:yes gene_type:complete
MIYSKGDALVSLRPMAAWSWLGGEEYSNLSWIDSKQTKPTEDEINTEVTRLNNAEPMRLLRVERNKRLASCDWVCTKAIDTGVAVSDTWKTYRQALRDLPASASPKLNSLHELDLTSVTWPTEPS